MEHDDNAMKKNRKMRGEWKRAKELQKIEMIERNDPWSQSKKKDMKVVEIDGNPGMEIGQKMTWQQYWI